VPTGEQISFQPALAQMLAQHLHHAAVRSNMVVGGENFRRGATVVTSNTAPQRLELISSGLKTRKLLD
jgi:hypothetical protein